MKMTRRLKILLGVLVTVVALCVVLLMVDLLPALSRMRQKREELKRMEAEIQRSLLEVRLRAGESGDYSAVEIPELPEIAAFITSLRKAQEKAGVEEMSFDTVQTEREEVMLTAGESEESEEYILSRLNISFSSGMLEAAEFLAEVQRGHPDETFDYLRFVSKSPDRDKVDVAMAVRLYGVSR